MADKACLDAVKAAAAGKLSDAEVNDAFNRVNDFRNNLSKGGLTSDQSAVLRRFVATEAERTRIGAAIERRKAAINALKSDKLVKQIETLTGQGMTYRAALLAMHEGASGLKAGAVGGRDSVHALSMAYEAKLLGGLMAQVEKEQPHLVMALGDKRLDADIATEMYELREGGTPGSTKNKDAVYMAKVFASYAELSRTILNKLGASIGKLDGWAGSQVHDDIKLIAAGKEPWIAAIAPKLDAARTFPDASSPAEIHDILSDIYDTIITGMPAKTTPAERGQRVNPANLAKSLGKSRVLHFRDASSALSYREQFGYGTTVSGMFAHFRNTARMAALMDKFGPNPEVMVGSLVDRMARKIRDDPKMSPEEKAKQSDQLKFDAGPLRHAFDIASGLNSRPVNTTGAKISSDIRAGQSIAKLGGALISSVSDVVTTGVASQFRGGGMAFFDGFLAQLNVFRGRPHGELGEITFLTGEGFDGIIGHIVSPAAATDGPVGVMGNLQEKFFRWNGLTFWTDVRRGVAGRVVAAEMGMRAAMEFANLPANYRHVLSLHSIDEAKWNAIRKAGVKEVNGHLYITPDKVRNLPDSVVEPLVADRLAAIPARAKDPAARRAAILDDAKRELELDMLRFVADETSFSVIETDYRSRRSMTLGLRPGTVAGEAIRFATQFKGFPTAFLQRTGARTLFGQRPDASYMQKSAHIGTMLAGMTMAGYAAMTMKDMLKGYWPPRDPTKPETWAAAFVQGGAAGIYGDFLFSRVNRFGNNVLETAAGPTIGMFGDAVDLALQMRDVATGLVTGEEAKMPYGDALNLALNNAPMVNLFYVRPVLDVLFLNAIKEAISPGFMKRQEGRREAYGQKTMPILGDRMAF